MFQIHVLLMSYLFAPSLCSSLSVWSWCRGASSLCGFLGRHLCSTGVFGYLPYHLVLPGGALAHRPQHHPLQPVGQPAHHWTAVPCWCQQDSVHSKCFVTGVIRNRGVLEIWKYNYGGYYSCIDIFLQIARLCAPLLLACCTFRCCQCFAGWVWRGWNSTCCSGRCLRDVTLGGSISTCVVILFLGWW